MSGMNVARLGTRAVEQYKSVSQKFNAKIQGTFVEKLAVYLRSIFIDYKEVAVTLRKDIKEKPVKATFVFTGIGIFMYSLSHNPTEQKFRAKFLQCCNEVNLVQSNQVNRMAADHLAQIQRCYNKDLIRHTSFGVFSIIWENKYSKECKTYESNCSYLQVPYKMFASRILDVGFWNIWWITSRKMLDYDINY